MCFNADFKSSQKDCKCGSIHLFFVILFSISILAEVEKLVYLKKKKIVEKCNGNNLAE